jgi:hypothetical protein
MRSKLVAECAGSHNFAPSLDPGEEAVAVITGFAEN